MKYLMFSLVALSACAVGVDDSLTAGSDTALDASSDASNDASSEAGDAGDAGTVVLPGNGYVVNKPFVIHILN